MARRTILFDRGWRAIHRNALGLNGRGVKVGILGSAGAHDGGTSIVDVAVFNEFGTETAPARPFMRRTADENEDKVRGHARALVRGVMSGLIRPDQVLDRLGLWYQARVRETIRNAFRWAAPNAPSTIRRKGSSKPLIDTGRMLGAVNYEKTRL